MSTKPLVVDCPTCQKKVNWTKAEAFRPFCSERCQQIDLGAWASEEYSIPVEPQETWSEEAPLQGESQPTLQ